MAISIGLSTSSVYPEGIAQAFALAAELGYDGVEVMVTADPLSQDAAGLAALAERYGVAVISVHAPALLLTARVWGTDPLGKLERSVELAAEVGAGVVVTHPPFIWQLGAAGRFPADVARVAAAAPVKVAVENMYPLQRAGLVVNPYRPHWDPVQVGYPWYTLDLSHTAVSGSAAVAVAAQMGAQLGHVHLADGSGSGHDDHLVPGRGIVACAQVLHTLVGGRFAGAVVVEVSTRRVGPARRRADLTEALAYARRHLGFRPLDWTA